MRNHGDHDAMAYDGPNSDIAHLCQICGQPMPDSDDANPYRDSAADEYRTLITQRWNG